MAMNLDIFRDKKGQLSRMGNILDKTTIYPDDKIFDPDGLVKALWDIETELEYSRNRIKLLEEQLANHRE